MAQFDASRTARVIEGFVALCLGSADRLIWVDQVDAAAFNDGERLYLPRPQGNNPQEFKLLLAIALREVARVKESDASQMQTVGGEHHAIAAAIEEVRVKRVLSEEYKGAPGIFNEGVAAARDVFLGTGDEIAASQAAMLAVWGAAHQGLLGTTESALVESDLRALATSGTPPERLDKALEMARRGAECLGTGEAVRLAAEVLQQLQAPPPPQEQPDQQPPQAADQAEPDEPEDEQSPNEPSQDEQSSDGESQDAQNPDEKSQDQESGGVQPQEGESRDDGEQEQGSDGGTGGDPGRGEPEQGEREHGESEGGQPTEGEAPEGASDGKSAQDDASQGGQQGDGEGEPSAESGAAGAQGTDAQQPPGAQGDGADQQSSGEASPGAAESAPPAAGGAPEQSGGSGQAPSASAETGSTEDAAAHDQAAEGSANHQGSPNGSRAEAEKGQPDQGRPDAAESQHGDPTAEPAQNSSASSDTADAVPGGQDKSSPDKGGDTAAGVESDVMSQALARSRGHAKAQDVSHKAAELAATAKQLDDAPLSADEMRAVLEAIQQQEGSESCTDALAEAAGAEGDSGDEEAVAGETALVDFGGNGSFGEAGAAVSARLEGVEGRLVNAILRSLQDKRRRPFQRSRSGSQIATTAAWRLKTMGDTAIFRRKAPRAGVDAAIDILLDASGSMEEEMAVALEAAFALSLAHHRIPGAQVSAAVFPGYGGSACEELLRFKESPRFARDRFVGVSARGSTPTGRALAERLPRLIASKAEKKTLYLITDGQPDRHEMELVDMMLKLARDNDVQLVGIGIGTDISHLIPNSRQIESVQELADAVQELFTDEVAWRLAA